jgi:hypothetical protein
MAGDAECAMGQPSTAQRRVAALMAGGTGCDTRHLYSASLRVQSAKSATPVNFHCPPPPFG